MGSSKKLKPNDFVYNYKATLVTKDFKQNDDIDFSIHFQQSNINLIANFNNCNVWFTYLSNRW